MNKGWSLLNMILLFKIFSGINLLPLMVRPAGFCRSSPTRRGAPWRFSRPRLPRGVFGRKGPPHGCAEQSRNSCSLLGVCRSPMPFKKQWFGNVFGVCRSPTPRALTRVSHQFLTITPLHPAVLPIYSSYQSTSGHNPGGSEGDSSRSNY